MEADAGASRLNPEETDDSSSDVGTDQPSSEATAEKIDNAIAAEDSAESDDAAGHELDSNAEDLSESTTSAVDATEAQDDGKIPSRLGHGWFVGITAALLALAGGVGAGGYLALRSHQDSQTIARHDAAALAAAKDCVAATQAPDTNAMAASAQKMIDCGSGAFRSQAILYSSLLVEAYQAANAQVRVSDLRAAVERNNGDGSIDVLVPMRVAVSNSAAQNQETGYRLRVTMVPDEGHYRISKLDQVAK